MDSLQPKSERKSPLWFEEPLENGVDAYFGPESGCHRFFGEIDSAIYVDCLCPHFIALLRTVY